jgi:hypothetical protein
MNEISLDSIKRSFEKIRGYLGIYMGIGITMINAETLETEEPVFLGNINFQFQENFLRFKKNTLLNPRIGNNLWVFGSLMGTCYKHRVLLAVDTSETGQTNFALEKLILLDAIKNLNFYLIEIEHPTDNQLMQAVSLFKNHRKGEEIYTPSREEISYLLKKEGYVDERHFCKVNREDMENGITLNILDDDPVEILEFLLQGTSSGFNYAKKEIESRKEISFEPVPGKGKGFMYLKINAVSKIKE